MAVTTGVKKLRVRVREMEMQREKPNQPTK
jgi:hypothetical protein